MKSVGCSQNLSDVSSIESNKMETKRIIPSHNGGARANPIGDQQPNNIGSDATDNEDKGSNYQEQTQRVGSHTSNQ